MSSFAIPVSPETLGFSVTPVPCFQDNYSYIIRGNDGTIALVDPCEPPKVLAALDTHNIRRADVAAILTTHKHWDHAGGNEKIVAAVNKAKDEAASSGSSAAVMNSSKVVVVGGVEDAVSCCTLPVSHDDVFIVGGLTIRAIHTPCHTRGHICFHVRTSAAAAAATGASTVDSDATAGSAEAGAVFTGDTLFVGGTGRLFEGNAAEMYANLTSESKLGGLPGGALVYAGHEYTKSNLLFAVDAAKDAADSASSGEDEGAAVAAASSLITSKLAWVIAGGADGAGLTMPSSMKQERETNVFILAHSVKEFAKLRTWKDDWRAST